MDDTGITATLPQPESSKKDLHLLTNDESQHIQHRSMPSLSDTLNSSTGNSSHTSEYTSPNHQEKPPDIQRLDQICTPHTPVPSNLRKDVSLPSLSSTILKQTATHPLHHPHPHHPHNLSSSLSPPTNGSTAVISCADYNSLSTQSPLEITTNTSSPNSSSLSPSTTASSTSQSSITNTINSNSNSSNGNGNANINGGSMDYSHTQYSNAHYPTHRRPVHHQRYHHNSPLESGKNCTMVPSSRPKRMRRGNQEPKMRRVQPLARDSSSGEYRLPAHVGILTVHALGRVVPLTTYHNDRYIWPPGFKVSRTYLSMVNSEQNTVYTCTVEENGEQGPRFRVIAEDSPDQPIIANSATGVWTAIVKRANEIRNREHSNSASGPDYYGFTHATIAKMIQDLPGADQCLNYVWQKFGVMHQRTAAGVAAAAQKKLANLEIMGSANKRAPPPIGEGFVLNKDDPTQMVITATSANDKTPSPPTTSIMKLKDESRLHSPPTSQPPLTSLPPPTTMTSSSSPPSSSSSHSSSTLPPVVSRHLPLPPSSSSSVLPSLATMTSTAAAAAAAVDSQRNDIFTRPVPISSPSSSSSTSVTSSNTSTSLQQHSLHHHHHSSANPASSDISTWSTLTR
ncbi:unnamed protein product [Absidia cylindrospora]